VYSCFECVNDFAAFLSVSLKREKNV
jgi:hypothetical protein